MIFPFCEKTFSLFLRKRTCGGNAGAKGKPMKTVAVICEYNPFHRGHAKQLSALRERFAAAGEEVTVLALMSGNYVQRGEPALFDKYIRTKAALLCGADLVAELPYPYCAAPADRFARAGVYLAERLGADTLAFGSESLRPGGEEALLRRLAAVASFRESAKRGDRPPPGRGTDRFPACGRRSGGLKRKPECPIPPPQTIALGRNMSAASGIYERQAASRFHFCL